VDGRDKPGHDGLIVFGSPQTFHDNFRDLAAQSCYGFGDALPVHGSCADNWLNTKSLETIQGSETHNATSRNGLVG
jgi:hypothetical protein